MFKFIRQLLGSSPSENKVPEKASSHPISTPEPMEIGVKYTLREGRSVKVDSAFEAWTSGNLDAMLAAVSTQTNNIDRHHLLQSIVDITYKQRLTQSMRDLCEQHARLHLAEFPSIAPSLRAQCDGNLPTVTTFQKYATSLTEQQRYDEAVEVCRQAIFYGLTDGTKSGFEGRISRILKSRADS